MKREEKRAVCPYDCPDECGMLLTLEDGKLIGVKGDPEHPRTKGFLCRKTKHYEEMVYHPKRILYPLKRVGEKGKGEFQRISWQQAITEITEKWQEIIARYGAEAILPYSYAGTEGLIQGKAGEAFFHYLGASRLKRTICSSGRGAGWSSLMGSSLAMPAYRMAECDRILIWSSNIAATRIHEIPYIQEAKRKGAKVTLIDVYETPAAAYCDELLLIRPGSDAALALAMLHIFEEEDYVDRAFVSQYVQGYELLKESLKNYTPAWAAGICGLSEERIYELARSYARANRPCLLFGGGAARQKNGAMITRCVCAVPTVLRPMREGYGITGFSQSGSWGDISKITRPDFDRKGARTINMMQLAEALDPAKTNPPVKSLYVYNSNPVDVTANQKRLSGLLEREDLFLVVHERFLTDTALYADLVLPAVFSLESYDIFKPYGYNSLQYNKKAASAPGECKSNWETFCLLAKALGFADPYFEMSEEEKCLEFLDHKSGQQAELSQKEWESLLDGQAVERRLSGRMPIKTKSGKIELYNPALEDALIAYRENKAKERYPIHLVAAPNLYSLNSTFISQQKLMEERGKMTLLISAEDASARGITDGQQILCENELASVLFYAEIREGILPGTAVAEGVYSKKQAPGEFTVNALFSEELTDLGEATTMNGNFVEIRPLAQVNSPANA